MISAGLLRREHLPIYRAAFDLAVHLEKIVKNFSRYHKYTLGSEFGDGSRRVLQRIIEANEARDGNDREPALEALRRKIEQLKVTARLAQESEAFASTRAYLHVAEQVVGIARPGPRDRSRRLGLACIPGVNQASRNRCPREASRMRTPEEAFRPRGTLRG